MAEVPEHSPAHALIREMGLTEQNLARRRHVLGLEEQDFERISSVRALVLGRVDEHASVFFDHLAKLDEAPALASNRALAERGRSLQREHLVAMVRGDYTTEYVAQRIELALLYTRAGLELRVFLAAFHHLLRSIGTAIMKEQDRTPLESFEAFLSLKKVAFFDVGLIVDAMMFERERTIRQQQDAIRELSTPVLQIRDRMLLLPIIGVIDTHRARLITENLLMAVRSARAKVVVVDITGVATIDSKVANHLLQTVTAAKLMGACVIVTGLSADVAQSLVALGIDLAKLNTAGDLQGGLEEAELLLGLRVVKETPARSVLALQS